MCVPDNTPADKSAAVKVVGVGTNASEAAAIGHVMIPNRGDHEIRGVTLHWSLSKDSSNPAALVEGNTAMFRTPIWQRSLSRSLQDFRQGLQSA